MFKNAFAESTTITHHVPPIKRRNLLLMALSTGALAACGDDSNRNTNINLAPKASVDRFSETAGHLFKRSADSSLPAANAAINLDRAPFITLGFGSTGAHVVYYNLDVQSRTPDDIYVFFDSAGTQVAGQNNVIPTIPGDTGYNDFWRVSKVTVPSGYQPNTLQSEAEIVASGYTILQTNTIVNCPVVPFGSTAARSKTAGVASTLTLGWYKNQAVAYFNFDEAALTAVNGEVPTDDIYVTFNIDPGQPGGGPASGFKTEPGTAQTHNVLASTPGATDYSPLWAVSFIANANFASVTDLTSALTFTPTAAGVDVNCPVVQ